MTDDEQQAEDHRLRRTSRHLIFSLVAVAVFGLAFLAVYLWVPRPAPAPGPEPAPSPSGTVPIEEHLTVLIQATTAEGAMGSVLTGIEPATGGGPYGVLLALPPDLVVTGPASAPEQLSQTVASLDTLRPASSVAATLGVEVDASWRLDRKALAGLVDSVNGVTVDVPERMRIRDESNTVVVSLRAGRQRLSGTTASWYAVGTVAGQSDLELTERFDEVLLRTLARLPASDLAIRESLTALGALAPSTIATQDLASYLQQLGQAIRVGALTHHTVPTTPVRIGPTTLRWTEYTQATPLVRNALPHSLWQAGVDGPPRVLGLVPGHEAGWMGYIHNSLAASDFVFVDGRGTATNTQRTAVRVRGNPAWGAMVADRLGLPRYVVHTVPGASAHTPQGPPWANVDVVLGPSFRPGAAGARRASSSAPATPAR